MKATTVVSHTLLPMATWSGKGGVLMLYFLHPKTSSVRPRYATTFAYAVHERPIFYLAYNQHRVLNLNVIHPPQYAAVLLQYCCSFVATNASASLRLFPLFLCPHVDAKVYRECSLIAFAAASADSDTFKTLRQLLAYELSEEEVRHPVCLTCRATGSQRQNLLVQLYE